MVTVVSALAFTCRSSAAEGGGKSDARAKVATYLEADGVKFAAAFAKAAAKGSPKSDRLQIRRLGALLHKLAPLSVR